MKCRKHDKAKGSSKKAVKQCGIGSINEKYVKIFRRYDRCTKLMKTI